ncbi:MAG: hypothetical protein R3F49_15655 [Planctomycetota bacterium]
MKPHFLLPVAFTSALAYGQVSVNGTIAGDNYCASSIQTVETQFGDNASEINGAYGALINGRLYLAFTGNLESNFNKLEIFIDSVPGGENILSGLPGNDGAGVMAGLRFDPGFEADYHIIVRRGDSGGGPRLDVDLAQLGTANYSSYGDIFAGSDFGLGDTGTGLNTSPIRVAYNGSNAAGVLGGCNPAVANDAAAVMTGLELSVALSDVGFPSGPVKVCAFINGSGHNYASNQFVGGFTGPQCNLGGDGAGNFTGALNFDLGAFAGNQYFELQKCPARTPIFGVDFRQDRIFTTDTAAFGASFNALASYAGSAFAIDFSADGTTLWGVEGANYGKFDLTTGAFQVVGALSGPTSAAGLTALADGATWYLLENAAGVGANLWVGDITTGSFSLVGTIGTDLFIDLAADAYGRLYAMEITNDSLYRVDPMTATATLLGPTGFATNFAQGMDFDWTNNVLYAALYTGGGSGTFATLDLVTGAGTAIESTTALNAEMEIAVRSPAGLPNQGVCVGNPNSTGFVARFQVTGSTLAAQNNVLLTVHYLPPNSAGYFINSPELPFTVLTPAGAQGDLCIASYSQGRHAANLLNSGANGAVELQVDLTRMPQPGGPVSVMGGTTWAWQYWYRDTNGAGGTTSNFSNARLVKFF